MSEYTERQRCVNCRHIKSVFRNYEADNVVTNYIAGLHECETLGEYADKQTAKMSQDERDAKLENFKTKPNPDSGMKELPAGMSRSKSPEDMPRKGKK